MRLDFVLISSLSPVLPMVSCSLWLWCCCTSPPQPQLPALCAGSPVLVLCTWASLQGLGSQPSPTPQHWNLFVFSPSGMGC